MGPSDSYEFLRTLEDRESFDILFISFNAKNITPHITPFFPNLKWVQALGTGVDPLLVCEKLKCDPSITLTNMKSVSSVLLAEFAVFGLLYFYKRLPLFQAHFQKKTPVSGRIVDSVENRRVLITGIGSIGQEIARKFKFGLNMKVTGVKRDVTNISHLSGLVEEVIKLEQVPDRVSEFDVIVNAMPSVPNGPVFDESVISKMKKGAVFINVGRGNIVDEHALVKYLLNGHLLGAALDVIDNEPIREDSVFYDERLSDKLFYSFHKMDGSVDYDRKLEELLEENVRNYVEDRELLRVIDKKLGY